MKKLLFLIILLILAIAMPFFVVIRGTVFVYQHYALNPWLALLAGSSLTLLVLFCYGILILKFVFKDKSTSRTEAKAILLVSLFLVVAYTGYSLLVVSDGIAKNDTVASDLRNIHPIIVLAVNTLSYLDSDLVITDIRRTQANYQQMGLRVNYESLHFVQASGYVHAVDIRTVNRGEIRNRLVQVYFWLIGFDTLRHVGTADHLHVSLQPRIADK